MALRLPPSARLSLKTPTKGEHHCKPESAATSLFRVPIHSWPNQYVISKHRIQFSTVRQIVMEMTDQTPSSCNAPSMSASPPPSPQESALSSSNNLLTTEQDNDQTCTAPHSKAFSEPTNPTPGQSSPYAPFLHPTLPDVSMDSIQRTLYHGLPPRENGIGTAGGHGWEYVEDWFQKPVPIASQTQPGQYISHLTESGSTSSVLLPSIASFTMTPSDIVHAQNLPGYRRLRSKSDLHRRTYSPYIRAA